MGLSWGEPSFKIDFKKVLIVSISFTDLYAKFHLNSFKNDNDFRVVFFHHFSRVRSTINRSHSTLSKTAEFEHLQFFQDIAWDFFLHMSDKICHLPFKKVKKQPSLIISFSQHSSFFEGQPKIRLKSDQRHTLPGECVGESVTKSPHKGAFFCISLTNIDQCLITCAF